MITLSTALLVAPAAAPALAGSASAAPTSGITAPADPSSKVIVPGREIGLAGTDNTRTLAGYIGHDGKRVNDRVLRSDNLSKITANDTRILRAREVRTVVDLRTVYERTVQPDRPVPGAQVMVADVLGGVSPISLIDLKQAYAEFVTNAQARREIRRTLLAVERTAATGGTTLYHCSAGKDRTGWTTAVLLTILGVDRATVDADYLASNHYRHASPNDPLNGVNIGLLNTSYAAAAKTYGSVDGYIRHGLGLSDADIASLRASLLV